jgi:hypothetical protein
MSMKNLSTLLSCGVLLLASPLVSAGAVIVAADSSQAQMEKAAVQAVFLGQEQRVGGAPVVVVFQKTGAARTKFDGDVLGKPGAQLTSHWSRLIFTGRAKKPEEANSDADVVAKVASTPGAIGYVDTVPAGASVKVVFEF